MFDRAKVRELREGKGLSARVFGERVGIGERTVRRYEAGGGTEPSVSTAGRMAEVLGVPLDELIVHDEERTGLFAGAPETDRAPVPTAARR